MNNQSNTLDKMATDAEMLAAINYIIVHTSTLSYEDQQKVLAACPNIKQQYPAIKWKNC